MFENILVPLDGSELSEQALPVVRDLARQLGSTVHLIQVVPIADELGARRVVESIQIAEIEVEQARRITESRVDRGTRYVESVQAQLEEAGIKVDDRVAVGQGDPADQIVDYVKAIGINLVVMTSRAGASHRAGFGPAVGVNYSPDPRRVGGA
jgi:nucleotide-binding universal stress UspA family protein